MEDSELEPLAHKINVRPRTGVWSARAVNAKFPGAAASSTNKSGSVWSRATKDEQSPKTVYSLLAEVKNALEEGHYVQAVGAYREAATLSRVDKALKESTVDYALKEIKALTANNWRVAEALLLEVLQLGSEKPVPAELTSAIERSAREEVISNTLAEVKPGGDSEQVYARLKRALRLYPDDPSLQQHLGEVSSLVVAKRGASERSKRLEVFNELLACLERSTKLSEAQTYAALSKTALGPYAADAEIAALSLEIQRRGQACEQAFSQLAEGNLTGCVFTCSEVLYYAPQQRLLQSIRQQARHFVYVDETAAAAQVSSLLEKGPLADAQAFCAQALTQFPQSPALANLATAIREKETKVNELLAAAETSISQRDVEGAGLHLSEALGLLPADPELRGHEAVLLQSYARTEIDHDWRAFDAALELASRLQPNRSMPADLAAVVQRRRQHAETIRQQAQEIHKTAERGLQADVLREATTVAKPRQQGKLKTASAARVVNTNTDPDSSVEPPQPVGAARIVRLRKAPAANWFDKTTIGILSAVAATLVCAALLAWQDHQTRVAPRTQVLVASAPDNTAPAPVKQEELAPTPAATTQPTPLATLEIRGAEPGTEVRVDNVLLGAAVPGSSLTRELSSGDHVIELLHEGYLPKRMALHFAPGEVALLTGSNVQLVSTDASIANPERRDSQRPSQSLIAEINKPDWQDVDKKNPSSLQAFIGKYPDRPETAQARELLQNINHQNALLAEQNDWQSVNKTNKTSLSAFVSKYPNGIHSTNAASLIDDLDHRAMAEAAPPQPVAETPKVVASLDVPRREEHTLPVIRSGASPDPSMSERAAVLDVIGRFASAWNAKDYRSIVAIEPDLNRRVLKAQLSPVKAVMMRISPVAPPEISGTQATVVCRRQADEMFEDGSLKQNPESIVTYVLSKRNGAWGIEAIR